MACSQAFVYGQANQATRGICNQQFGSHREVGIAHSDILPGLSLDLGNLKLLAVAVTTRHSGAIVLISGLHGEKDAITQIDFELPRRMESAKQCAAWFVWCLDQHFGPAGFRAARNFEWMVEGKLNRRLLPWVLAQAEYEARPACTVRRDWLRLALKDVRKHLAHSPGDASVDFTFDGLIFSIRCHEKVMAFRAEGKPWTVSFRVPASSLQTPPRRMMRECVDISIWDSRINFDSTRYEGSIVQSGGAGLTNVQ